MQLAIPAVPGRRQTPPSNPPPSWWRTDVPERPRYLSDTDELSTRMHALAKRYPHLARVVDIGDSELKSRGLGGRDIEVLVLGEHADDPDVPRVLHVAGIHPREIANPEVLLRWAERTLDLAGHGDPATTALLAGRTVGVLALANPDGYDRVVAGLDVSDEPLIWQRTNANPDGGVDLNRNFDAFWGAAGDARADSRTYRGSAPASESETRAVQSFARSFGPSAVYDWHSAGGTVLYPWGHTPAPPAAIEELEQSATAVARATGYTARSSWEQWSDKTSATLKDWAHHSLHVPALTIETGTVPHQDDAQFADTLARVLPALDLLAATIDGRHAAPPGAERFAAPPPRGLVA